jgi:murein DD-endopeptidase MepM/ murein hydrolase activator NlpD
VVVAAALLYVAAVPFFATTAGGAESLDQLQARMDSIQGELDATTEKIEALRTEQEETAVRIGQIEIRMKSLSRRQNGLEEEAIERADFLYRQGPVGMAETLLEAENFAEMMTQAEMISRVSQENTDVFMKLARSEDELGALSAELEEKQEDLASTTEALKDEVAALQEKFEEVSDDYKELKKKLAAARARREARADAAAAAASPASPPIPSTGGKVCPVAGPTSFVDSWGAPRVGHTHVGVDMMADYGTPLVAIVSGTITYSGYSGTGGNMIFLSGNDGNTYWYLHNQENLVTSGSVKAGQQIATVGDTGNAVGIPHLHFEYHPGGGGPVNPYPLVAPIC